MQSIPRAMLSDLWRHGRWYILAGVLGANLLPVLLFAALRLDGALDPREPSQIVMQMILLEMNVFIFAAAMFAAQEKLPRLYAMPIATSSLVTWRLLPMMAAVGMESAASSAAMNVVFGLEWPIWGPALFGAAAVAAFAAALWLTEDSSWIFVAFVVVPSALGLWLKGRYGEAFSTPAHLWQELTFLEVATMLAVAVGAYYVAVAGVSLRRRGERLPSLGIIAWLERLLDPAPYSGLPFRSAVQAQAWYEWRRKGLAMPAAVIFGLVVGLALWLIVSRNGNDLLHGLLFGGGLLSGAAVLGGVLMGNCGPDDANYEMGSFLATRPITTIHMARTILKASAKSVLIAWLVWAAAFLTVYLIVWATHSGRPALPRGLSWWYFPATLIGAWTTLGLLTSAGLGGRRGPFLMLFCGLPAAFIGVLLFAKFALAPEAREPFLQATWASAAVLGILLTAWAFAAARRRKLIGWTTVYVAGSLWVALASLVAVADIWHAWQRPALFVSLVGVCALALAPLAAAPLALAWNRTR